MIFINPRLSSSEALGQLPSSFRLLGGRNALTQHASIPKPNRSGRAKLASCRPHALRTLLRTRTRTRTPAGRLLSLSIPLVLASGDGDGCSHQQRRLQTRRHSPARRPRPGGAGWPGLGSMVVMMASHRPGYASQCRMERPPLPIYHDD